MVVEGNKPNPLVAVEINRGVPILVQVCSCTAMDRTNGRRRAHEVGRLWKTTGAGSAAALALEEFGPAGSLEAARSTKAARTAGFRAAGLETAWVAQLPPGCRGS